MNKLSAVIISRNDENIDLYYELIKEEENYYWNEVKRKWIERV
jgi:hypothetical protein